MIVLDGDVRANQLAVAKSEGFGFGASQFDAYYVSIPDSVIVSRPSVKYCFGVRRFLLGHNALIVKHIGVFRGVEINNYLFGWSFGRTPVWRHSKGLDRARLVCGNTSILRPKG